MVVYQSVLFYLFKIGLYYLAFELMKMSSCEVMIYSLCPKSILLC
jgi:hypothetical protein